MSDQKTENNLITDFFRESGVSLFESRKRRVEKPLLLGREEEDQKLKLVPDPEERPENTSEYWRHLRNFYRTGKGGGLPAAKQFSPALLRPYREWVNVQRDYPFWVAENDEKTYSGKSCLPLSLMLEDLLNSVSSGEEARVLSSYIPRLLYLVRQKLVLVDSSFSAFPVVKEGFETLIAEMDVSGEEGKGLIQLTEQVLESFPKDGLLIPFSSHAPIHLLAVYLQNRRMREQRKWQSRIRELASKVHDILTIEKRKDPDSSSPEKLQASLEFAGDFLNFNELSNLIPHGGTHLPADRVARLEKIAQILSGAESILFKKDAFLLIADPSMDELPFDWKESYPGFSLEFLNGKELIRKCSETFHKVMSEVAEVFAALRIAALELDDQYVTDIHGDFFAHFNWRQFNEEEFLASPPVVLVVKEEHLLENELNEYSRLLASNLPVKVLAERKGNFSLSGDDAEREGVYRQQLGALAVAHRNAYIMKTTSVSPFSIHQGYDEGFSMAGPALFFILSPEVRQGESEQAYLWASSAIESRDFPSFSFDPELGPKWGSRFDLLDNPQTERDWPVHTIKVEDPEQGETELRLTFTTADFALLDSNYHKDFQVVPPKYWDENLVSIDEFLSLPAEEVYYKVPYVWVADNEWNLHRAAVSRELILLCLTRLDFWHYLQENAGVHSYHVERAVDELKEKMESDLEARLGDLREEHKQELEKAREEAAGQAMEQLADMLLDLDKGAVFDLSSSRQNSAPANNNTGQMEPEGSTGEKKATGEEEKKEAVEEEEMLAPGEAYIDTPLCTSCNECININNRVFTYDANKQAVVADPAAGSFEEIVRAAESCPVAIIHPGAPQNPDEANLDSLIERASKFQ